LPVGIRISLSGVQFVDCYEMFAAGKGSV